MSCWTESGLLKSTCPFDFNLLMSNPDIKSHKEGPSRPHVGEAGKDNPENIHFGKIRILKSKSGEIDLVFVEVGKFGHFGRLVVVIVFLAFANGFKLRRGALIT